MSQVWQSKLEIKGNNPKEKFCFSRIEKILGKIQSHPSGTHVSRLSHEGGYINVLCNTGTLIYHLR